MSHLASSLLEHSRLLALLGLVLGITLVLGAVFADPLGLSGGGEGVGWKQLIAAIAGLIVSFASVGALIRQDP